MNNSNEINIELTAMFKNITNEMNNISIEIKKHMRQSKLNDMQIQVHNIMLKQFYDLYSSIESHYKYEINETSLNVVFRSYFETCLNFSYLYVIDDNIDLSQKLDSYIYWTYKTQRTILENQKKFIPVDERKELIDKIKELKKLSNKKEYKEIKKKAFNEDKNMKYWYGFYSDIKQIDQLSKYVGLETFYKVYYSYLSTSAHGTKIFEKTYEPENQEDLEGMVFHSHFIAALLLEKMSGYLEMKGISISSLDKISESIIRLQSLIFIK